MPRPGPPRGPLAVRELLAPGHSGGECGEGHISPLLRSDFGNGHGCPDGVVRDSKPSVLLAFPREDGAAGTAEGQVVAESAAGTLPPGSGRSSGRQAGRAQPGQLLRGVGTGRPPASSVTRRPLVPVGGPVLQRSGRGPRNEARVATWPGRWRLVWEEARPLARRLSHVAHTPRAVSFVCAQSPFVFSSGAYGPG